MSRRSPYRWLGLVGIALCLACGPDASLESGPGASAGGNGSGEVAALMQARGLNEADVSAALKTYTPTGGRDEYLLFGSGGHSGQVIVIGLPSMRLLKVIAVFTPEHWQGYG
jgi:nitrous-oxide reductase